MDNPALELNALVDWASQDVGQFSLLLDQLEQLTRELIQSTLSGDAAGPAEHAWINSDGARILKAHTLRATQKLGGVAGAREFWTERSERMARARQEILAPLNKKLLAQDVLLPWLRF